MSLFRDAFLNHYKKRGIGLSISVAVGVNPFRDLLNKYWGKKKVDPYEKYRRKIK